MSCESERQYATGLCRRCYTRFRYHELHNLPQEEEAPERQPFCGKCSIPLTRGNDIYEFCYTQRWQCKHMQYWYCGKCGYATTTLP